MPLLAIYLLLFPLAAQADLYKCTDHAGKITYTNSPCAKTGLKQAKVIPPPPPPAIDKPVKAVESPRPSAAQNAETTRKNENAAAVKMLPASSSSQARCAGLNSDMGRIMDKMDAANRSGHPLDEGWGVALKKLQGEKNRLGCF